MLVMPEEPRIASIVGIDPGTVNLGIAILWFDVVTLEIKGCHAKTYNGTKMGSEGTWDSLSYGDRYARIRLHEENLFRLFQQEKPLFIVAESPFFNQRHPMAYGALTEVVCGIRSAVKRYDGWKALYTIDPPSVKKAVGAKHNADKHAVKEKVMALEDLQYDGDVPLSALDEHSIDAIAVAVARLNLLREEEHGSK